MMKFIQATTEGKTVWINVERVSLIQPSDGPDKTIVIVNGSFLLIDGSPDYVAVELFGLEK